MSNTEREEVLSKARAAKEVAPVVAQLSTPRKNEILQRAAENLIAHTEDILTANKQDIEAGRERGIDPVSYTQHRAHQTDYKISYFLVLM